MRSSPSSRREMPPEARRWRRPVLTRACTCTSCACACTPPEPPYCTYGLRAPASCVLYVPKAQDSCAPVAPLYVLSARASLGTAYRGTTGGGGPRAGRRRGAAVGARPRARARARAHAGAAAGGQGGGRRVTQAARGTEEQEEVMVFGRSEWVRPWRERRSTGPGPSHDSMHVAGAQLRSRRNVR